MLDIACDACGKKYRVDETQMRGTRARVKCKACSNVMVITRPQATAGDGPPVPAEIDQPPAPADIPEPPPPRGMPRPAARAGRCLRRAIRYCGTAGVHPAAEEKL